MAKRVPRECLSNSIVPEGSLKYLKGSWIVAMPRLDIEADCSAVVRVVGLGKDLIRVHLIFEHVVSRFDSGYLDVLTG